MLSAMAARYTLLFAILVIVMGALHYFVWTRLVRDMGFSRVGLQIGTAAFVILYVLLLVTFFATRFLSRSVSGPIAWLGYTWLGALFFLFVTCLGTEAVRQIAFRWPGSRDGLAFPDRRLAISRILGGIAALGGIVMSGAGMAEALARVQIARIRVGLRGWKLRAGYRIVQISDVHVGPTIGHDFIETIVAEINALKPDLVVITGDLVDGSVEDLREHVAPLTKIVAKDGVFFVTGNHEYYSGAEAWCAHLTELGIRVLRNERVRIGGEDGFDLAGIDDVSSRGLAPGHGPDWKKALADRDPSRPVVLLAHQPKGIEHADALGVDLQLSGHTHGGQLFPWNYMVPLQQPFVAGLHRLSSANRAQIYVSRGTGYWGPPMRLGAPSEITEITVEPA